MYISLYDQDIDLAARLTAILRSIPSVLVEYVDHKRDSWAEKSDLVVADPWPETTADFIAEFRATYPEKSLLIITENPDILSATRQDKCYAMTKPVGPKDIIEVVRTEMKE